MTQHPTLAKIDEASRVRLGADPLTLPWMLGQLASDPAVTVRAAVAMNAAASTQSDRKLANDGDERVRLLLARKIAIAMTDLPAPEQARLCNEMLEVLTVLVRDEAMRVRAAIAEVVASLPGLPHALVLELAHDHAIPVSEPVIRLSPLLSADDLLALLASPPHAAATHAVARRAYLPESVSDAIAATTDTAAIRALLANDSAAIRESTLDALIDRAAGQPAWHGPMVRRPTLPTRAARALSEIVAAHQLEVLRARTDLDPALAAELRLRVAGRLATGAPSNNDAALMEAARILNASGGLGEPALLEALRAGELRRAAAMLAVAAGIGLDAVDRAIRLRSAKAFVSLVWKAGFSMHIAATIQATIGQISPTAILPAAAGGSSPLSPEEMRWQMEFLSRTGR